MRREDVISPIDDRLFSSFVERMGRTVYTGVYKPCHPTAGADSFREDVAAPIRHLDLPLIRYPGATSSPVTGFRAAATTFGGMYGIAALTPPARPWHERLRCRRGPQWYPRYHIHVVAIFPVFPVLEHVCKRAWNFKGVNARALVSSFSSSDTKMSSRQNTHRSY